MASFGTLSDGTVDDRVRIVLNSQTVRIAESYQVKTAILQQPSAFSLQLGSGDTAATIIRKYPPRTPFQLRIGNLPQFSGETDGYEASDGAGATQVAIKGRDYLARLHDADVQAEQSFKDANYAQMVRAAMNATGLSDRILQVDNNANRKVRAGSGVYVIAAPKTGTEVTEQASGKGVRHIIEAHLGETWLSFCNRHLERAGLFLWCDFEGNIVVSRPNPKQRPVYKFTRRRGQKQNICNVEASKFLNDTTRRFSGVNVYSRTGGRKFHHTKLKGGFIDPEMVALGYERSRTFRDVAATTHEQAEFYARRKIAEANRAGWSLQYTLSGHVAPSLMGDGLAVITPDTVAHVQDDEYGIDEDLYIESVEYRSPPTTTVVTMMRLKDLVFGADE